MSDFGRISTSLYFNQASLRTSSQESKLYSLQQQLSSSKKINAPSDDPLGAASLSIIKDQATQNGIYKNAIASARSNVSSTVSVVETALGQLQNAYQLTVQARNGSYGATDLKNIGASLQSLLSGLVQTANSQDGSGNYLFSGSKSQTQPFQFDGTQYAYSGDQTVAHVRTGTSSITQTSWTGQTLFAGAQSGDGVVDATAGASNAGNAIVSKVIQSSPGSYNGDQYSVAFTASGSQIQATVTDTTTSTVVLGPSNFTSGQALNFAGVNLTIDGTPVAGDTIVVGKAQRFNVLDSLNALVGALSNSSAKSQSEVQNTIARSQQLLTSALSNITTEAALMGSELNGLDVQQTSVEDRAISLETARSGLEDIDFVKAYNDFTAQKNALTASLQSFASISSLSLFNYLR